MSSSPVRPSFVEGDVYTEFSASQLAMWIAAGGVVENLRGITWALRVPESVTANDLSRAVEAVVTAQPSLRLELHRPGDGPDMILRSRGSIPIESVDLMVDIPEEVQLRETALELNERPFRVAEPLLRIVRLAGPRASFLVVKMAHLISDGVSVGIFADGLVAALGGQPLEKVDPSCLVDHSPVGAGSDKGPWSRLLAGCPGTSDWPLRSNRGESRSHEWIHHRLSDSAMAAIREMAAASTSSPFTLILAGVAALHYRVTGVDDFLLATVVTDRGRIDRRGVIGPFFVSVPLRCRLWGSPTFPELVDRIKVSLHSSVEAAPWWPVHLQESAANLAGATMISYQSDPFGKRRLGDDSAVGAFQLPEAQPEFPLSLEVIRRGRRLEIQGQVGSPAYDPDSVRVMLEAIDRILVAASTNPELGVLDLDVFDPPVVLADPPLTRVPSTDLVDCFRISAGRFRDNPAVVFESGSITYQELDLRSDQIAFALRAAGVAINDRVAIKLPRGTDQIAAMLGVLKAGAAYVPIDLSWPEERARRVIRRVGAAALLCTPGEMIAESGVETVTVPVAHMVEGQTPLSNRRSKDAYVLYTSGSTGEPKGVIVKHENVLALFVATERYFGFGPDDAHLMFHSMAFDFSVWEIWSALLYGGALVIASENAIRDPRLLLNLIDQHGITAVSQTPAAFAGFQETAVSQPEKIATVRVVTLGGAALHPKTLHSWRSTFGLGKPRIFNMYGITETTVHSTIHQVNDFDVDSGESNIGYALPHGRVIVCSPWLEPLPGGLVGELVVGGLGVTDGYDGEPGLTAERFIRLADGTVAYKSGDLGAYLPNGEIEYLGRRDRQVKVRGYRVELDEIRALVIRSGLVSDVELLLDADESSVRAFVVCDSDADSLWIKKSLLDHLRERLPHYMIPADISLIDRIPLTQNGKVDYDCLRRTILAKEAGEAGRPASGQVDGLEPMICEIWSDVLDVPGVATSDDFFEIGGHSIRALQCTTRLQQRGLPITVADIFTLRTPSKIAAKLRCDGLSPIVAEPDNEPSDSELRWLDRSEGIDDGPVRG